MKWRGGPCELSTLVSTRVLPVSASYLDGLYRPRSSQVSEAVYCLLRCQCVRKLKQETRSYCKGKSIHACMLLSTSCCKQYCFCAVIGLFHENHSSKTQPRHIRVTDLLDLLLNAICWLWPHLPAAPAQACRLWKQAKPLPLLLPHPTFLAAFGRQILKSCQEQVPVQPVNSSFASSDHICFFGSITTPSFWGTHNN